MPPSRVEMLRGFIAQKPQYPFPRYALAHELKNAGDLEGALAEFEVLLRDSPEYVASYLHAGGTLVSLGRHDQARDVFQRGIAQCARVGDTKTRGEIESALAGMGG